MAFKIIAFDSDGIGAMGSALMLRRLDPKGQLIRNTDMFAGNGMGAITALALASGIELDDVIAFFQRNACHFFAERGACDVYSNTNLTAALTQFFGLARLCELPLSGPRVMANIERRCDADGAAWHSHSIGSARRDPYTDMLLSDLALSASSADGYFDAYRVKLSDHSNDDLFRTAHSTEPNPSATAMVYAEKHFGIDQSDMQVLSLGIGNQAGSDQAEAAADTGSAWGWSFSRFTRSLRKSAGLDRVDSNCRVSALAERYHRIQLGTDVCVPFDGWNAAARIGGAADKLANGGNWKRCAAEIHRDWVTSDELGPAEHPMRLHPHLR